MGGALVLVQQWASGADSDWLLLLVVMACSRHSQLLLVDTICTDIATSSRRVRLVVPRIVGYWSRC